MSRPTRQQQLDNAVATAKAKIHDQRKALAALQSQQREGQRKARDTRRYQVGRLVEDAGLAHLADSDLSALLRLLATIASAPNPVEVLEGLLADVRGTPGRSVPGCATPSECVSRAG